VADRQSQLPLNIYRVAQRRFDAIPGSPWVYWVSDDIRELFERLPSLGEVAQPRQGLATADNFRFLRYWWEVGPGRIGFGCLNRDEARVGDKRWFPHMKGGAHRRWYGNQEHAVNWQDDGRQMCAFAPAVIRNPDYYFREGVTFTDLTGGDLSMRWTPPGFLFDHAGNCLFPSVAHVWPLLAILNSKAFNHLMHINPTIHYYIGDFNRMPVPRDGLQLSDLNHHAQRCTRLQTSSTQADEATFDFVAPPRWDTGIADQSAAAARLAALEAQINDEVYRLYGISDADRAAIEAELAGGVTPDHEGGEGDEDAEREEGADEGPVTREELAVRWISYAVGIVLGRFQPGVRGALGSAIYHRDDFAIGSLPAPDEVEFDELIGPPERFACVGTEGGRHLFAPEVEAALRALALTDGIAVLDEGRLRDLPALVERALGLMLEAGKQVDKEEVDKGAATEYAIRNTQEVIRLGANGDLRAFLSKDFFTEWHLRWYRKRPVYWPLQSARRSCGFVLFHERVDRLTLYTLQRDYLDYKLNAVRQQVADLNQAATMQSGASRRATEREAAKVAALLDELTEFARTMERIVRGGYEPEPNWIDDGVILRLAPLWELLPLWRAEPKKYWERLARGDFDWSHIAMKYWPARVRAKCATNKSFAIAHGLAG
jgi:hypothetical protein